MKQLYVSERGFQSLCDIRLQTPPPVTPDVRAPVQLLACVPSEECACPEELWVVSNVEVLIHMEENGDGHIIVYAGDEEIEKTVAARDINDLRAEMFSFLSDMWSQAEKFSNKKTLKEQ